MNSQVLGASDIALTANGAGDADVTINADITSSGSGAIDIYADSDITHNSGTVVSTGGAITETASLDNFTMNGNSAIDGGDVDIYAGTDFTMNDSSSINSTGDVDVTSGNDTLMYGSSNIHADVDVNIDAGGQVIVSDSTITAGNDAIVDAVNDISLGVIEAGRDIRLTTTDGSILDTNLGALNLTAPNLYMNANQHIGASGDFRIDTDVTDIWEAIADNGDVWINESDDVNLRDIQALGSTVDIITGGDTYAYSILANGYGPGDDAIVNLDINSGSLFAGSGSSIQALQYGDGDAKVIVNADSNINIIGGASPATVEAIVKGYGSGNLAEINLVAGDSITLTYSDFLAELENSDGDANIIATAANDLTIDLDSTTSIIANTGGDGTATVDLDATIGSITIDDALIEAAVDGAGDTNVAEFNLNAGDRIDITNSDFLAGLYSGNGTASIIASAVNGIRIDPSTLTADITAGNGDATIDLATVNGDIEVVDSDVSATVGNDGNATVTMTADTGSVTISNAIKDSHSVVAKVTGTGNAEISMYANGGDVDITNGDIEATTTTGNGTISMHAANNITIDPTDVIASVLGNGNAGIYASADSGGINITDSTLSATVSGDGEATVDVIAEGSVVIGLDPPNSIISALVSGNGDAFVGIKSNTSTIDITNGDIDAAVSGDGNATIDIEADGSVTIDPTIITASTSGTGDAFVGIKSVSGPIDLMDTYVKAEALGSGNALSWIETDNDNVNLERSTLESFASTGRSDVDVLAHNGSILADAGSLIKAQVAGLLARNHIGESISPIRTEIETLLAYSHGVGDIYINEADDIKLGGLMNDLGAIYGVSVAANNGTINITSAGDMIVNSVVSPGGGVFLETTGGSIYAGSRWCPSTATSPSGPFSPVPNFLASLSSTSLMDMAGTEWNIPGGVIGFSPIIDYASASVGPNVIAGGYSYFSAPVGTIGIGNRNGVAGPADDLEPTALDNPLSVCIQVLSGNLSGNNSAVPISPSDDPNVFSGGVPIAGLTLDIGGVVPSTYFNDGYNGTIGLSGAIEGIVRPGTTAVTDVFPSPVLAYALDSNGIEAGAEKPSGYVFYDDSDANCCTVLSGPAAINTGPKQIWPIMPPQGVPLLLPRDFRIYYELSENFRVSLAQPLRATEFFAYHPLSSADFSAFDDITLDFEAYEFIEDNIDLKKKKSAPFFGI